MSKKRSDEKHHSFFYWILTFSNFPSVKVFNSFPKKDSALKLKVPETFPFAISGVNNTPFILTEKLSETEVGVGSSVEFFY